MAEVAAPRELFRAILEGIGRLRLPGGNRMKERVKATRMKTGNHGGGVCAPGWKRAWKGTTGEKSPSLPEKNGGRTEKRLANLWKQEEKSRKKAYAGRWHKTKWEMSV